MSELSKALRKQLALSGAKIVRIDRAVVGMIAEDIEQLESELSRLREENVKLETDATHLRAARCKRERELEHDNARLREDRNLKQDLAGQYKLECERIANELATVQAQLAEVRKLVRRAVNESIHKPHCATYNDFANCVAPVKCTCGKEEWGNKILAVIEPDKEVKE